VKLTVWQISGDMSLDWMRTDVTNMRERGQRMSDHVAEEKMEADDVLENSRLQELAVENDSEAQFQYACWLRDHPEFDETNMKSTEYLKRAAEQRHCKAAFYYGLLLRDGCGTERNIEESINFLGIAADCGDRDGRYELGWLLLVEKQDRESGLMHLKLAADQGHICAACRWGELMVRDNDIRVREEGFFYLQFAADFGNVHATTILAQLVGGERALAFVRHSFKAIDSQSQFQIGMTLTGFPKTEPRVASLFQMAADRGHVEAKYRYALMLRDGIGVSQDIEKSIEYLQSCDDIVYPKSAEELGKMCRAHPDVAMRVALSLRTAADRGDPRGLYAYGKMLLNGWGIERDESAGIDYLRRAADCGHWTAKDILVIIFTRRRDFASRDFYLKLLIDKHGSTTCVVHCVRQLIEHDWETIDQCLELARQSKRDIITFGKIVNALPPESFGNELYFTWLFSNPWVGIYCMVTAMRRRFPGASVILTNMACLVGISSDVPGWEDLLLQAADDGHPGLWAWVGVLGLKHKDPKLGIRCLLSALAKENQLAGSILSSVVVEGNLSREQLVKLASSLRKMAENGNIATQLLYGQCLSFGRGVKPNPLQAFEYFQTAAQNGSPFGHFMCGVRAMYGIQMSLNYEMAIHHFRLAFPEIPTARYYLGSLLIQKTHVIDQLKSRYRMELCQDFVSHDDCEVSPEIREAIEMVKSSADACHSWSSYVYGFCLELGFGMPRNSVTACELYSSAAIQKLPDAQYRLSLCLRDGVGVAVNHAKAMEYLKQAADVGHTDAQYDLAMCLILGIGCAVNETTGLDYLRRSAEGLNCNARLAIIAIADDHVGELREAAERWSSLGFDGERAVPFEMNSSHSGRLYLNRDEGQSNGYPTGWTRFLRFSDARRSQMI
jgi:TPR repeat protein